MSSATARKTLVLNADYRPISTWPLSLISAEDAICSILKDRMVMVEEWPGEFLRSPSTTIPIPKVGALRHYAPINATPKFCRRSVLLRDRYRCQYCGERFESKDLTFDHVTPRAAGGKTVWNNILMACVPCNIRKRDTLPNFSGKKGKHDKGMRPLKQPRQPTTAELLRAGLEFLEPQLQEDFASWLYWDQELSV